MKKVLLALALIIGTSSFADAGELDGKAVFCSDTNTGLVFSLGRVTNYHVKGYAITNGEWEDYYLDGTTHVKWSDGTFGGLTVLDRETLKSSLYGQCVISSKQKVMEKLNDLIANAKKKNKI